MNLQRFIGLSLVAVLGFATLAMAQSAGNKYAVLVGVKEYHHASLPKLRYTENDVSELADLLRRSKYEVILLTDAEGAKDPKNAPTKANIDKAVALTLKKCQKNDTVIIGLAGHGLQFAGKPDSYFCPTEAKPFPEETNTLVSVSQIYAELERSFAGVKVLLVDACRDDPTASRGASRGIDADTAPRPPRGVAALFSCSAGEVAYEHERYKHGVFFHFVLEGLRRNAQERTGEVTFDGLSKYVRNEVAREVPRLIGGGARQSPNLKADLSGASPVLVGMPTESRPVLSVHLYDLPSSIATRIGLTPKCQCTASFVIPGGGGDRMGLQSGDVILKLNRQPIFHTQDFTERLRTFRLRDQVELVVWRENKEMELKGPLETSFSDLEALRRSIDAAQEGDFHAMTTAGNALLNGNMGGVRDESEGLRWLKKAAELGHVSAMNELGHRTFQGRGIQKDEKRAMELFQQSADLGYGPSQYTMGMAYVNGLGVSRDLPEGIKWLKKAAEQSHVQAIVILGQYAAEGRGMEKSEKESANWYRQAAEQHNALGEIRYAVALRDGKGVEKNVAEALTVLRRGIDRNNLSAIVEMGFWYGNGFGVDKDDIEAARWYERAANAGNLQAQLNMAYIYQAGRGVPKDLLEAVRWYQRAAAQDSPEAEYSLGRAYLFGIGVAKDEPAGVALLRRAVDHGHLAAHSVLADCFVRGRGVTKNAVEAVPLLRKAVERGYLPATKQLGQLYRDGIGVARNYEEALKWFRQGADKNDPACQMHMGYMVSNGFGTTADPVKAVEWYRKAIAGGESAAMTNLGVLYETGRGVAQDHAEAIKLYRQAAERNDEVAQTNIGLCYFYGRGVGKDYSEAVKWFRKGAENDNPRAMGMLGNCLEQGLGVSKNQSEAIDSYKKAAALGDKDSVAALKRLNIDK